MLDVADTRSLALLYHLNSEPAFNEVASEEGYAVETKEIRGAGESIVLPQPTHADGLLELIRRRRSCRAFATRSPALADIAEILTGTYGLTGPVALGGGLEVNGRAVPSAGGLYPLELYLVLKDVELIADGLYHYNVIDHALEPSRADVDRDALAEAFVSAPFLVDLGVIVFMAAVFDRTLHKYGARGYRFILLEAGHAAQNLCLLAAERGLASLCLGGFMDTAINRLLGLEPGTEGAVYCVGLGAQA